MASGQSNMAYALSGAATAESEIPEAGKRGMESVDGNLFTAAGRAAGSVAVANVGAPTVFVNNISEYIFE
jgi:hypothetical protein